MFAEFNGLYVGLLVGNPEALSKRYPNLGGSLFDTPEFNSVSFGGGSAYELAGVSYFHLGTLYFYDWPCVGHLLLNIIC